MPLHPLTIRCDNLGYYWLLDPAGQPTHTFPLRNQEEARVMQRTHLRGEIAAFAAAWAQERERLAAPTGGRDFEVRPCSDGNRKGFAVFDLRNGGRGYRIFRRKCDAIAACIKDQTERTDLDNRVAFQMTVEAFAALERRRDRQTRRRGDQDSGAVQLALAF